MDKLKEYVDAIDVPIALKNFSNDIQEQFNIMNNDYNKDNDQKDS